jgi:ABC-type bacteriocin/lantibiotic exporter with double-glycine peptidase domain
MLNTIPFYQRLINPKDILSRFEDLSKYVNNFFSIPGRFASRLLLLLLFCVLLYELSSKFFLILAAATLIQGWVIYRFKNRQIHLSQIQTEKFYGYENILTEYLRGLSTLIQMRSLPQAVTRISHKFEEYLKQEENKLIFHGQLGFIVQSVEKISIILTVILALTLYLSGKLGVGDIMVAITTTVGASDAIINYVIQAAELLDQKILSDRVIGLQTYPSIKRSKAPLSKSTTGNYSIDTRELFFTYPGVSNQPTLQNISISLTGPGLHFLCGPSGSGKSTLVQIIAGQFPEGSHQKAISTDNYSTQQILDSCLYLSGDDPVLPESLVTNMTLRKSGDHVRLIEYLRNIWNDEHRSLDDYLDRNLVNLSMTMSSGQLQRLLFGRAVYAQPRLLILDECFSSVDHQTDQWIVSHLKEFLPKTLIILISHRPELSIYSDKIIFMRNGKVSSQGTPWEVIKTSDEFMEFFKKSRGIS